jgi:hypothetical protein
MSRKDFITVQRGSFAIASDQKETTIGSNIMAANILIQRDLAAKSRYPD